MKDDQQIFGTDARRKNFNSAKARLQQAASAPTLERYPEKEPVFVGKHIVQSLDDEHQKQEQQRERIQQAVKKPKDVFGEESMQLKPIQVASYILGKNQRPKNPAKARMTPTDLPKANGGKSKAHASSTGQITPLKGIEHGSAQKKQNRTMNTANVSGDKRKGLPITKAFQNLAKTVALPSGFMPQNALKSGSKTVPFAVLKRDRNSASLPHIHFGGAAE